MNVVVINRHNNVRLIPTKTVAASEARSAVMDLVNQMPKHAMLNRQVEIECDEEFADALEKIIGRSVRAKDGGLHVFAECPIKVTGRYMHPPV